MSRRKYQIKVFRNPDPPWEYDSDGYRIKELDVMMCEFVDKDSEEVIATGVGDNRQEAIYNARQDLKEKTSYEEEEEIEKEVMVYQDEPEIKDEKILTGILVGVAVVLGIIALIIPSPRD